MSYVPKQGLGYAGLVAATTSTAPKTTTTTTTATAPKKSFFDTILGIGKGTLAVFSEQQKAANMPQTVVQQSSTPGWIVPAALGGAALVAGYFLFVRKR